MRAFIFLSLVAAAFAVRALDRPDCDKAPDAGLCDAYMPRYYYDQEAGECKTFVYGGCGGNKNNFWTEDECYNQCGGPIVKQQTSDVCTLEKKVGLCYGRFPRYYYDHEARECKKFIYGGCQGNGNNFKTLQDCEATCSPAPQAALDRPDCDKAPDAGLCDAYMPRYYYDQEAGQCKTFVYGGCGGNRNNFRTEDECYNKCGALRSPSACEQEKVVGPCFAAFRRFFYNKETGQCELFIYGGCAGNNNNFQRLEVCEAVCVVGRAGRATSQCNLKPDTGICKGHFQRFYYDPRSGSCKEFVYGGCGGNDNNFETLGQCLDVCSA